MRLGILLFACLFLVTGPRIQAQESQQVPNAPSSSGSGSNVPAAPAPQPYDENPPGSLGLPNLLHQVTPGEGTQPAASSSEGTPAGAQTGNQAGAPGSATAPPPEQSAPSNVPPPVIPAHGQGASQASYTLRARVNFVLVPVTVKDSHGQLVSGLTWHDFQLYENNVQQHINFFTEDPFPLSVAFVIDQSLPADTMRKVNEALSGLQGAFAPYDEVSVYTYASHVSQATGFTGARSDRLTVSLQRVKSPGNYMEVPSNTGPMAEGPIINGQMVDPNTTPMHNGNFIGIIPKEQHVLNDAIFRAATDLSQRSRGRRRLIYVISDGKNQGSKLSYREVVRYLLTNQIAVYGTLVGESALPIYGFLDRFHIPLQMSDDILPKYTLATGGALDAELSTNAIERSFAKISEQVRDQYTLGYNSHISALDSRFRKIEVRVLRPNVNVIRKTGILPDSHRKPVNPMTLAATTSVLGLSAAAIWGASDFCGGIAARHLRVFWLLAISHAFSLGCLLLLGVLLHQTRPDAHILALGFYAGIAGGIALLTFYHALSLGEMGTTAALTGLLTAALPVVFTLVTVGSPNRRQLIGFALAAVAIWLISSQAASGKEAATAALRQERKRIALAVISGLGFGAFLIFLRQANGGGLIWPLAASRVGSLGLAVGGGLLFSRDRFTRGAERFQSPGAMENWDRTGAHRQHV